VAVRGVPCVRRERNGVLRVVKRPYVYPTVLSRPANGAGPTEPGRRSRADGAGPTEPGRRPHRAGVGGDDEERRHELVEHGRCEADVAAQTREREKHRRLDRDLRTDSQPLSARVSTYPASTCPRESVPLRVPLSVPR
jgi:hypothetical protein